MAQRRLLLLDVNRLSAYSWNNGRLAIEGEFAGDAPGIEAFGEYLKHHRSAIFYLMADVAEEGFQIDDVPYIQGRDRAALIQRRLGQYFYGTPLATAISLGREKTGRRDEKLMFTAFTRPQHFDPWLEALRAAEAQLCGIYSLALVSSALHGALGQGDDSYLLITLTSSGLRQTFFDKGQVRFSRLTPLATGSLEEATIACTVESTKIYQYLVGQRLLERRARLNTFILVHPAQAQAFRDRCSDSGEIHFEFPDLLTHANKAGLKNALQDSRSELLFLHLLVRQTPSQQFAPAPERHFYRLWQTRAAIQAASALVIAGCLLFAAKQGFDYYSLKDQAEDIRQQAAADRQKYDAMLRTLPPVPLGADQLRALIGRFNDLSSRSPDPQAFYVAVSKALDEIPSVELQDIGWMVASSPDDSPFGKSATAKPAAPGVKSLAPSSGYFAIAEIHAQLPASMVNDHRKMLEIVDRFVATLKKDPANDVKVLRMPFDVESEKTIRSTDEDAATQVEPPKFSLRVVRRLNMP